MLLLLARHAAHAEVERVLSGRTDAAGLSDAGRKEGASLAGRLVRHRPTALYASPRRRALETASIVGDALGLATIRAPELDELDFGAWTGRDFASLADDPVWRGWNEQRATAHPPGGEAMHEAASRVMRWIAPLAGQYSDATVLAVTHADVIKAALLFHLGASLDAHWRLDISPASLSALDLWPGGGRVRFINHTTALGE